MRPHGLWPLPDQYGGLRCASGEGGSGADANGNFGAPTPGGAGGGQGVAGFCWVAREVYGSNNIKWLIFREWITTSAPKWLRNIYRNNGESFAQFIKNKPYIKSILKYTMDKIIAKYLRSQRV